MGDIQPTDNGLSFLSKKVKNGFKISNHRPYFPNREVEDIEVAKPFALCHSPQFIINLHLLKGIENIQFIRL